MMLKNAEYLTGYRRVLMIWNHLSTPRILDGKVKQVNR
jgi:hypothetical protein